VAIFPDSVPPWHSLHSRRLCRWWNIRWKHKAKTRDRGHNSVPPEKKATPQYPDTPPVPWTASEYRDNTRPDDNGVATNIRTVPGELFATPQNSYAEPAGAVFNALGVM